MNKGYEGFQGLWVWRNGPSLPIAEIKPGRVVECLPNNLFRIYENIEALEAGIVSESYRIKHSRYPLKSDGYIVGFRPLLCSSINKYSGAKYWTGSPPHE